MYIYGPCIKLMNNNSQIFLQIKIVYVFMSRNKKSVHKTHFLMLGHNIGTYKVSIGLKQ